MGNEIYRTRVYGKFRPKVARLRKNDRLYCDTHHISRNPFALGLVFMEIPDS